jgi:hypothetical protein
MLSGAGGGAKVLSSSSLLNSFSKVISDLLDF